MQNNTKNSNIKKRITMILIASLFLVCGLIAYLTISSDHKKLENKSGNNEPNTENIANNQNERVNNILQGVKSEPTKEQKEKSEKKSDKETTTKEAPPSDKKCVMPCNGEILTDFSIDALVFSQTMDDWRIHTGVDLKGDKGEDIVAIKNGTVQDVYYDEMMGYTVTIKHIDGAISVYSNLENNIPVSSGDKVLSGDVIGKIGTSAIFEGEDEPHLHFEVIKDENHINPIEYIKN